ncbi:MAG: hypothetical protein HZB91_14330, partial [Elusimicrobia bacterium]|nr:hypothetical protein [Elusimicrobiota bacterium]
NNLLFELDPLTQLEQAWFTADHNGNWDDWKISSGAYSTGQSYAVEARSIDGAGNYSATYATAAFIFDTDPPYTNVNFPADKSTMTSTGFVWGTAYDNTPTNPGTITQLRLRIKRLTDDWYWTGGSWVNTPPASAPYIRISDGVKVHMSSWSVAAALPALGDLTHGASYFMTTQATDSTADGGNTENWWEAARASTFTVDKVPAVSRVNIPVDHGIFPAVTQIAGTAVDLFAGIPDGRMDLVEVSIKEISRIIAGAPSPGGAYWNGNVSASPGGTFTATTEQWYCLAGCSGSKSNIAGAGAAPALSAGNWSFNTPFASLFQDQITYQVRVRARDSAKTYVADPMNDGNSEVEISSISFTKDVTAPGVAVKTPPTLPDLRGKIKSLPDVMGTAYDDFGILYASVSYQNIETLLYFDGADFLAGSAVWFDAPLTGIAPNYEWTALPPNVPSSPPLKDGTSYYIVAKVRDASGNTETFSASTYKVLFDTTAPTAVVDAPVNNGFLKVLTQVTGQSADPRAPATGSGLVGSQILIQRQAGSAYWTGSGWGVETWLNPVAGSPWTKNTQLPPANNDPATGLDDDEEYLIEVQAYDVAGNTTTVPSGNIFRLDLTSPTAAIQLPAHASRKNTLTLVSGTARDNGGTGQQYNVKFPEVRIVDLGPPIFYWSGALGNWCNLPFPDPCNAPDTWNVAADSSPTGGEFTWRYNTSAIEALGWPQSDDKMRVDVRTTDEAGNFSFKSSTFSFDSVPPSSKLTFPETSGVLFSSMTKIFGTSFDVTSPVNSGDVYLRVWYVTGPSEAPANTTYYYYPSGTLWRKAIPSWWSIPGSGGAQGLVTSWSYTDGQFTAQPQASTFTWGGGLQGVAPSCTMNDDGNCVGNGRTFQIITRAVDGAANPQTAYSTVTFVFDNLGPESGSTKPYTNRALKAGTLSMLSGTADEPVSVLQNVQISVGSQEDGKWFGGQIGAPFQQGAEFWWNALEVWKTSWTWQHLNLPGALENGKHYVVRSSATDSVGNAEVTPGTALFLYDTVEPNSSISVPADANTKNTTLVMQGSAYDPGAPNCDAFNINNNCSGVYPGAAPTWQAGKIEIRVFRDTEPYAWAAGPVLPGTEDNTGYYWSGSTWVAAQAATEGEKWFNGTMFPDGTWQYTGLDCGPKTVPPDVCWNPGSDRYAAWTKVTDNAGNTQGSVQSIQNGPLFRISATPISFRVTVTPGVSMTAGDAAALVEVQAVDGPNGTGNPAPSWTGTVNFNIDGGAGPETMDDDGTPDETYGLPPESVFNATHNGLRTFPIKIRKAGSRALMAFDKNTPSFNGSGNFSVVHSTGEAVMVIADYAPGLGEEPAPGVMTGTPGRKGSPRLKLAGDAIDFNLSVVDRYYNLVLSSAATVWVSDLDPNNAGISPDGYATFMGSTTVSRVFQSASTPVYAPDNGVRKTSATGQGIANAANPSSAVTVRSKNRIGLLALLPGEIRVQGKAGANPGKSDSVLPSETYAGAVTTVTVYAVDQYYNTDYDETFSVSADAATDDNSADPPAVALEAGTTVFYLTSVTAATHTVRSQSPTLVLAGETSFYHSVNKLKVWWTSPLKLQLLAPGQVAGAGIAPYNADPTDPGGRSVAAKDPLTAGSTYNFTVNLTDKYFNVVRGTTPFINEFELPSSSCNFLTELRFPTDPHIQARGLVVAPYTVGLKDGTTTYAVPPVMRQGNFTVQVRDAGEEVRSTDTVSGITVNAGAAVNLQVLVSTNANDPGPVPFAGETADEGSSLGKYGPFTPLKAGATHYVKVRATDMYWNLILAETRLVRLETSDPYAEINPVNTKNLSGGEVTFTGFVPSVATTTMWVRAVDASVLTPKLSTQTVSPITVSSNAPDRLIIVYPGEYPEPGKMSAPSGVMGTASTQTAGQPFTAGVYATDKRYNWVQTVSRSAPNNIRFVTDDPIPSPFQGDFDMANGSATITGVTLIASGMRKSTGTDLLGGLIAAPARNVPVKGSNAVKLRVLLPNEARKPGMPPPPPSNNGRWAPSTFITNAGPTFEFDVVVDMVDNYWNLIQGASQHIELYSNDPYAVITPSDTLGAHQIATTSATFRVYMKRSTDTLTGGGALLNARMFEGVIPPWVLNLSADASNPFQVDAGIAKRLVVKLPGESFDAGSPTGRIGVPSAQTAGASFGGSLQVGVVDDYFNRVLSWNTDVRLETPADPYSIIQTTWAINPALGYVAIPVGDIVMRRATTEQYILAYDYTGSLEGSVPPNVKTSTFTLRPALPVGLQVVLPGQVTNPGGGAYPNNGLSVVNVATPTAGQPFEFTVNLVDQFMNVYNDDTNSNAGCKGVVLSSKVYVTTSDLYDNHPSTTGLVSGSRKFTATDRLTLVSKTNGAQVGAYATGQWKDDCCEGNFDNVCKSQYPAGITYGFKVYAAAAARLQVLLPGETGAGGKCDDNDEPECRDLLGTEGSPGKNGSPSAFTITAPAPSPLGVTVNLVDRFWNVVTDRTGIVQDSNPWVPAGEMPIVRVKSLYDPAVADGVQQLVDGSWSFTPAPRLAISSYTVAAATEPAQPASVNYSSGTSSLVFTLPATRDPAAGGHLHLLGVPASTDAGKNFVFSVIAHDQYHNLLSSGTNKYDRSVTFYGEYAQDPEIVPVAVSLSSGTRTLVDPDYAMFKKAGSRWIRAFDTLQPGLMSQQAFVTVGPGAVDSVKVSPLTDTNVGAGSLTPGPKGSIDFTAQLTDKFDNPITGGIKIYISTAILYGSTGTVRVDHGAGWEDVGASTEIYSDVHGHVGVCPLGLPLSDSPKLNYMVSSTATHWMRIWVGTMTMPADLSQFTLYEKSISGRLLTVGGLPKQLKFTQLPPAGGVYTGMSGASGGSYELKRYDDFDNITTQGPTPVNLVIPAQAVHTAAGWTAGFFGTIGDYGYRDAGNNVFLSGFSINDGETGEENPFQYHDKMASFSGTDPAGNTGEKNRPGYWTIQANGPAGVASAVHQLRVNPDDSSQLKLGFNSSMDATYGSMNDEYAGQIRGNANKLAVFRAQLQDQFQNPIVVTGDQRQVNLSTFVTVSGMEWTRAPSMYNDYVAFSSATDMVQGTRLTAPYFQSVTTAVFIQVNQYQTTFYYLDTTASNHYENPLSTKPIIELWSLGVASGTQRVYVRPNRQDRIAISSGAGQALEAGTTSQAFTIETRDYYGNASPLRVGEDVGGYVGFKIESDSPGEVLFSTPADGAFMPAPGYAYLEIGQSSTGFYLIDTLITETTHELSVSGVHYPSWETTVASYTVQPGPPASLGWATPPRKLIAGTTLQFVAGVTTQTVVSAVLKDKYGNSTSDKVFQYKVRFSSTKSSTYAGTNPLTVIIATDPAAGVWDTIDGGIGQYKEVTMGVGVSTANLWFWDLETGITTITAQARLGAVDIWAPVTQEHVITADKAWYLTIDHPYAPGNPAMVTEANNLTVAARDKYGNVAAGDPDNGQYFSGQVNFYSSGSTVTVTMLDPIAMTTYHVFTPGERGLFTNLQIVDLVQESLRVDATSYPDPTWWGRTSDSIRTDLFTTDPPKRSTRSFATDAEDPTKGAVNFAGIVVIPTDFAPESNPPPYGPIPLIKQSLGVTKKVLNQGDGTAPDPENPGFTMPEIPMLRMTMSVSPSNGPDLTAKLAVIKVRQRADSNLDPAHVSELALWMDDNNNARFDSQYDAFLGTGVYNAGDSHWYFGGVSPIYVSSPVPSQLSKASKHYFFTVRIASTGFSTGELPRSFGLELTGTGNITLSPDSQVKVAVNNFAIKTATSSVEREQANIRGATEDIAAWWQPAGAPTPSSFSWVYQGGRLVGMAKIMLWTEAFTGVLNRISLTHTGDGGDSHIESVRLFLDTKADKVTPCPIADADCGTFESGLDREVTDPSNPPAFPQGETRSVTLSIKEPTGVSGTLGTSTKTYFVAFDFDDAAEPDRKHGVVITQSDIRPLSGNGVVSAFQVLSSTQVLVVPTGDTLFLTARNTEGLGPDTDGDGQPDSVSSVPSAVTQNDADKPVVKYTFRMGSGAGEWRGLKLDRWYPSTMRGNGSYNDMLALNNKAADVVNIKLWRDWDGNGLFDVAVDSQVSPQDAMLRKFPTTKLMVALSSGTGVPDVTDIEVSDLEGMFPAENPFEDPTVPGVEDPVIRLVINDDQTDELKKEVVLCDDRDVSLKLFKNCRRGLEGTPMIAFSTGTVISGPAILPIYGYSGSGGQMLDILESNFFVTYDISPTASIGALTNIGLAIPNTHYFKIREPKIMSTSKVWVSTTVAGGLTDSYVSMVREVGDKVTLKSTNTLDGAMGPFVQQNSSVAVGSLQFKTNIGDARWRWLLVYGTGTATSSGLISPDVDRVSVWYDANGDGVFNPTAIPIADQNLGEGVFGYSGQPLTAQVKLDTPFIVDTEARAPIPQRFFVVYHVTADAQPTNVDTGQPRTLGMEVRAQSFPSPDINDDPLKNAISYPNYFDTPGSNVTWISKMRAIVASPQKLYIKTTPFFSSSSGTFAAPLLAGEIAVSAAGAVDTFWALTSTQGFPVPLGAGTTSYAVVDGEVISYDGLMSTCPFLLNVKRGQLSTTPAAHAVLGSTGPAYGGAVVLSVAGVGNMPAGSVENTWVLQSTAGLPTAPIYDPLGCTTWYAAAYIAVDDEIVSYSALDPTLPVLYGVTRGRMGTAPAAHAGLSPVKSVAVTQDPAVGPMVWQGQQNTAVMRMDMWTSAFQIQLSAIKFSRILPLGLNGNDTDVTAVDVYQSLLPFGDPAFHRDPISQENAGDPLVGTNHFGVFPDPEGRITVPFLDPGTGLPYVLISPSTKTFYAAVDVSGKAKFSHELLNPQNIVTGLFIADAEKILMTPANAGHEAVFLSTPTSPASPIMPTVNTVSVSFEQFGSAYAYQNDKNVPMVRMRLKTDRNSAILGKIAIDHTLAAGGLDTDATVVKIWGDVNGNGSFDVEDSAAGDNGDYPGLLSYGNESFSTGTVIILLKKPIEVSTAATDIFITLDISEFALENSRQGITIATPGNLTVQVPHLVGFPTGGFNSNPMLTIRKVTSRVTLGVNNITANMTSVRQAQSNVPFLRFNLATDVALAPWRTLRLERGGGSQDPSRPLGRNTDIRFVRVYKDINQDDVFSTVEDVNISEVDTVLSTFVYSTTTVPFDMVVASTWGFPTNFDNSMAGGWVYLNGAELMFFEAADSATGKAKGCADGIDPVTSLPCLRISVRGGKLGFGNTPLLNLTPGMSVRKVDVYDQDNDSNVQSLIYFKNDQMIGPVAGSFFAVYDIAEEAVRNDLVGVTIRDKSWFGMPRGDIVQPIYYKEVTRSGPLGTSSTAYPFVGTNVAIEAIYLSASGFTIAPAGAGQNQTEVPFLQLELKTSSDFVNIDKIRFRQYGTIDAGGGVGDGDLVKMSVWKDNGDRVFTPANDTLLGSSAAFAGGNALVDLSASALDTTALPYLRISTAVIRLFVTGDIGVTDRAAGTTIGHLAGVRLATYDDIYGLNGVVSATADPNAKPPVESRMLTIAPLSVPAVSISSNATPVIVVKAGINGVSKPGDPYYSAIGYPAYAWLNPNPPSLTPTPDPYDNDGCNNSRVVTNPRNNICRDSATGAPIPDPTKWLCPNGKPWLGTTPGSQFALETNAAAALALGQTNLTSNAPNRGGAASSISLSSPTHAQVVGSKLIVADAGNNRVLIWNAVPAGWDVPADVVVGQPNMGSNAAATGADRLNTPMALYSDGTKLLIADHGNNRVLIYNGIPAADNASADFVIGQADMNASAKNQGGASPGNATLSMPMGIHGDGARLFVADYGNNRVLIFNGIPSVNNSASDRVVGQNLFTSAAPGTAENRLSGPSHAYSSGGRLFVTDSGNNRVLVFNSIPATSGASADVVVGQPGMAFGLANQGAGPNSNTLKEPGMVYSDGQRLYVSDYGNNRVLVFNTVPSISNQHAALVLGQPNMSTNTANQGGAMLPSAWALAGPTGLASNGARLATADRYNHRVVLHDLTNAVNVANCAGEPPLLDLNGDYAPDNFSQPPDMYSVAPSTNVTLAGDRQPSRDMTRTGILDMDLNDDGIADMVFISSGNVQMMLGNDLSDQGNAAKAVPVPDQGFVPSAWSARDGQLTAMLPTTGLPGYYEVAIGRYPDEGDVGRVPAYSLKWSSVAAVVVSSWTGIDFRARAVGSPVSAARVTGLSLPVPNVTRLTQDLTPDTLQFTVSNADGLTLPGLIFVGSEVMRVEKVNSNTLQVIGQEGDPAPANGRGLKGSAPILHMKNEPVSDEAAVFLSRFVSQSGSVSSSRPLFVYRVDPNAPVAKLSVTGVDITPPAAPRGQLNVGLLKLELKTSALSVNVSQMRLDQLGTIAQGWGKGEGDFKRLSVWMDSDGDKVFAAQKDALVGWIGQRGSSTAIRGLIAGTTDFFRYSTNSYSMWQSGMSKPGAEGSMLGNFETGSFRIQNAGVWSMSCSYGTQFGMNCYCSIPQSGVENLLCNKYLVGMEDFSGGVVGSTLAWFGANPVVNVGMGFSTPYVRISTASTTLFVVADIGTMDRAGRSTVGHLAGLNLSWQTGLLGPNGTPLPAEPDETLPPALTTRLVEILGVNVPPVAMAMGVSTGTLPIIIVRAGKNAPKEAVGLPAYAHIDPVRCNNGKNPSNPRNNMCKDENGNWVPDPRYWICLDGSSWATRGSQPANPGSGGGTVKISSWTGVDGSSWVVNCVKYPPMMDINSDRVPDNFYLGGAVSPYLLSIIGDGAPSRDMTGTGILDMDLNQDGIVDMILPSGSGGMTFMLGKDPADQGNPEAAIPMPLKGFVPSAWTGKIGELSALLPRISTPGYYQWAAGKYFDEPTSYSGKWSTMSAIMDTKGMSLQTFRALVESASASVTTARIRGLTLPVPNVTRLGQDLTTETTYFAVSDVTVLQIPEKLVYVGSEIMRVKRVTGSFVRTVGQEGDPAPGNGRGLHGSVPIPHLTGEPVSDGAAIIFVQYIATGTGGVAMSASAGGYALTPTTLGISTDSIRLSTSAAGTAISTEGAGGYAIAVDRFGNVDLSTGPGALAMPIGPGDAVNLTDFGSVLVSSGVSPLDSTTLVFVSTGVNGFKGGLVVSVGWGGVFFSSSFVPGSGVRMGSQGVQLSTSEATAMFLFRPDLVSPSRPGVVKALEQGQTSFTLQWEKASQPYSGVVAYEVQERGGAPKDLQMGVVWRTLSIIPARKKTVSGAAMSVRDNAGPANQESFTVGAGNEFAGEEPRDVNQYYQYRVRALTAGGIWSDWSGTAESVATGVNKVIIQGVGNYPNPFDTRTGGSGSKTTIYYVLGADSDVTITIYDMLGYVVKTTNYAAGGEGGRAGPNFVFWDGKNSTGRNVDKGGYIARIKVKSPGGTATEIRKIGVIH